MEAEATAKTASLRFSLTIVDGRARLASETCPIPGMGQVERLSLEVPGLRFPFDLSQGARAFQSRRCQLVDFAFSVGAGEIAQALGRADLARYGLFDPVVEVGRDGLRLSFRAEIAGRTAGVSAKAVLVPRPEGAYRIALRDARVHGYLPVPAPLLLASLPVALGFVVEAGGQGEVARTTGRHWMASPPSLIDVRGLTEIDLRASEAALTALLASAGWRLPSLEGLVSQPLAVSGERLTFALVPESRDPVASSETLPDVPDRGFAALAEAALFAGEVRAAAEGFRRALDAQPDNDFARERLFQLLGAQHGGLRELERLADECLEQRPGFSVALVAKAVAAAEDGRHAEAGWLYSRLAARAEEDGEALDEVTARLAAAAALAKADDEEGAWGALDRATVLRPLHPGVRAAQGGAQQAGRPT